MCIDCLYSEAIKAIRNGSSLKLLRCLDKSDPKDPRDRSKMLKQYNNSLLREAIRMNSKELMEILLDHNCDINQLNECGHTPFTYSIRMAYNYVDYLVSRGAKLHPIKREISLLELSTGCPRESLNFLFDQFFLVDICYRDDKIRINLSSDSNNYSVQLKNSCELFQTVCKFSLSCTQQIVDKLFPFHFRK